MNSDRELTAAREASNKGDYVLAFAKYMKLAEAGNSEAQAELGVFYQGLPGVEPDGTKAVYWLQKAAESGDAYAAHNLGALYSAGLNEIIADRAQAYYWYSEAKRLGFDIPTTIEWPPDELKPEWKMNESGRRVCWQAYDSDSGSVSETPKKGSKKSS